MSDISLLICTYNRCHMLAETLEKVSLQILDKRIRLEVIVIDNNSSDQTAEVIRGAAAAFPFELRYIFEKNQGLSNARNRGIRESSGELVVFTDDDVLPESNWLQEIWSAYRASGADVLGGRVLPKWDEPPPAWMMFGDVCGDLPLVDHGDAPAQKRNFGGKYFKGANMAFKRSALNEIGAFDAQLGPKADQRLLGDDKDMIQRFSDAGMLAAYVPSAVVYHRVEKDRTTIGYFRKARYHYGISNARYHKTRFEPWMVRKVAGLWIGMAASGLRGGLMQRMSIEKEFWYQLGMTREAFRSLMQREAVKSETGMRVLYVESGSGKGGSAQSLRTMLRAVKDCSLAAYVASYSANGVLADLDTGGAQMLKLADKPLTGFWTQFRKVAALISKHKIGIVHLNNDVDSHKAAILACFLTKTPCVMHMRGIRNWTRSERLFSRGVTFWIGVSNAVAMMLNRFGVPSSHIAVLPNPVQVATHRAPIRNSTVFTVGNFNRWTEGKGHGVFLEAARRLVEESPAIRFLMLEPADSYQSVVHEFLEQMRLERRHQFEFLPWVPDIEPYMKRCDVIVNTSELMESFGRILVEAMACGSAVVATRVGAHSEIVRDGENGLLVEPKNSQVIYDAVMALYRDPNLRRKLQEKGLADSKPYGDLNRYGYQLMKVYEQVLRTVKS